MKYYIIAGEKSGDLHGHNLVKALKEEDPGAQFQGFGGDKMSREGVNIIVHIKDLAIMGFSEVILNFRKFRGMLNLCKKDIVEFSPDVVILIDFGGFNLRIAAFTRSIELPVFYYISPKVWAWNQSRAWKIKARVNKMFVILPFEKEFYQKYDWEVDYVGNPVVNAVEDHQLNSDFLKINGLPDDKKIIALLPGSRIQELKRILPEMVILADRFQEYQFVIAGVTEVPGLYYNVSDFSNLKIIYDQTYDLLANSHIAIVTSGTATLETALWNVPQVVVYKTSAITYFIASRVGKVSFISLVNLLAGKEVIKELIQSDFTKDNLITEFQSLLESNTPQRILNDYQEIRNILGTGPVSKTTARLMIKYLKS